VPTKARKLFEKSKKQLQERDIDGAILSLEQAIKIYPQYQGALFSLADISYSHQNYPNVEKYGEAYIQAGGDNDYTLYSIAQAEYEQAKFKEAIDHLNEFISRNPKANFIRRANELIASCNLHFQCDDLGVPPESKGMSEPINSSFAEYFPAISADGSTMVFTRRLRGQEDLFVSEKSGDEWNEPEFMEGINTSNNEGGHCYSSDGSIIIFTRCEGRETMGGCDLFFSQYKNDGWTKPRNMGAGINSRYWDALPTLSADKRFLIFSSDRPMKKNERRQKKILVSIRSLDGSWSEPKLLHPDLETPGDEQAPFFHPDMQTLYFTSNGFNSLGGSDLFVTTLDSAGMDSWTTPENLCSPINSSTNEVGLFVDMDGRTAYFDRDITVQGSPLNTDIYSVDLYEKHRAIPCTYVEASITDAQSGKPIRAKVSISPVEQNNPGEKILIAPGRFLLPIPLNDNFAFHVEADGYVFFSEHYSFKEVSSAVEPSRLKIELQSIEILSEADTVKSAPVILKNIFFETGKATLRNSSIVELDKLLALLNANLEMRIQINGHTDNVGSDSDNLNLSNERAGAVAAWLVENGIDPIRLRSKGYGEEKPIENNNTEEGRATNRRTEFVQW
jgi:outer membrane protein OmpA-like peptidoglycan-associated protein